MARVACSPATWQGLRYERFLDDAADVGYAGVEANRDALDTFAREIPRLRHMLHERSLTLVAAQCVGYYFDRDERAADLDRFQRVADFLAEINEGGIVLFRTSAHQARRDMVAGEPPVLPLDSNRIGRLADTLNELGDRCRGFGLTAAVMNRIGSYLETPDEYLAVVHRTEPELVALAPDLGHWVYAGGDVDDLVRDYRTRMVYPRLKGFDHAVFETIRHEQLGFRQFVQSDGFTPLDEGTYDLESTLLRFENAEYGGWVCLELEPTAPAGDDPRAAAAKSREYLTSRLHW
ncbi:MAG TPA: sugar phosphate isomerase/epimerase [Chloroflexota bacterium]|nr:sugar phosphate isomerase/epimerase [Chloroflexota bacterium]